MAPPTHPKFVSYYRVSTQRQGRSGLGLEAQQACVSGYLSRTRGVELASFVEVESGRNNARPQLAAALLRCRQTRSTLLIAKLDRLGRNAAFLFQLRDSGTKFEALDIPEANTLTLGVMISMAQHEAETISARTKAALAARVARGLPHGTRRDGSRYVRNDLSHRQRQAAQLGTSANIALARDRARDIRPVVEEARAVGHSSLRRIARYLNEREILTPRGRVWTPTAVRNVQKIIAALPAD